jgi:hypothetical protein
MVAGLPATKRQSRRFLVLQAYFDDSKRDGLVLVYCGYVARAGAWERFADEWEALCNTPPVRNPFKMSQAMRRNAQVRAKAEQHYRIIEKYVDLAVCCAVPIEPLARVVAELGINPAMENPFFLAWRIVLTALVYESGITEPIDVFYDEQTEKVHVLAALDRFMSKATTRVRRIIRNYPTFRRDTEFNPLQAADLLAWCVRKQFEEKGSIILDDNPFPWPMHRDIPMLRSTMEEDGMRKAFANDLARAKEISVGFKARGVRWV